MTDTTLIPAIEAMLRLQDQFNQRVNPSWKLAGYAWHRAIWMECAELMDGHCHWKWWKGPPKTDEAQARLELVDVWHFILSWSMTEEVPVSTLLPGMLMIDPDRATGVEAVARAAINRDFEGTLREFWSLAASYGLSFEQLHREYIAKNALNTFRNLNGYKDNSYIKVWDGREDNQHLAEVMDAGVLDFESILQTLDERYPRAAKPAPFKTISIKRRPR